MNLAHLRITVVACTWEPRELLSSSEPARYCDMREERPLDEPVCDSRSLSATLRSVCARSRSALKTNPRKQARRHIDKKEGAGVEQGLRERRHEMVNKMHPRL